MCSKKYPELEQYSKNFIVPLPADWPGWYYPKRLIATGWKPNVSIIPEQGPFHVYLNACEHVVLNFNFFKNYFQVSLAESWQKNQSHFEHHCVPLLL